MKKPIIPIIAILVLSSSAYAYIDPGTGGMIFRSIWPAIAAFFFAVGAFFSRKLIKPLKKIFKKVFQKSKDAKNEKKEYASKGKKGQK